jgi:hypothetical protein
MDYEKEYNHAFEIAKGYWGGAIDFVRGILESMFPQLAESEDERIRKRLIDCLKFSLKGAEEQDAAGCSRQKDIEAYKWGIAYLERQKEQKPSTEETELNSIAFLEQMGYTCIPPGAEPKPAEWSEEDDRIRRNLMSLLYNMRGDRITEETFQKYYPWIKSLPERFNLQPKQEWSEEDETKLGSLICYFEGDALYYSTKDMVHWLKSLRPQPHWKPSKEQMEALERAIVKMHTTNDIGILAELRDNLKKL